MTIIRRFLVLQTLMLWQGGFLFYAAAVVPTGTEVLGSAFEQGQITRFVTEKLNLAGALALVVFSWEILASRLDSLALRRLLWGSFGVMLLTLAALFLLHPRMVAMVDFENASYLVDRGDFRVLHRSYLWISTVQWGAGLLFALGIVLSWKTAPRPATSGAAGLPESA